MSYLTQLRRQFPALSQRINGQPLTYLDSAATAQKPATVIAAVQRYYRQQNANVHRGQYQLAVQATAAFEHTRQQLAHWLGAADQDCLIWTKGATEALNMIARCWAEQHCKAGDVLLVDAAAHHANLVPWQQLCRRTGATLQIIALDENGDLDLNVLQAMLRDNTVKLVALNHVSNVLGSVNPLSRIVELAHRHHACVVVDGAQAVAHQRLDLADLDVDFYVLSAHKMYGPTGLGALYGKRCYLEQFEPWLTGGEMVEQVTEQRASWAPLPYRLEGGTPNMAGVAGFSAALDFLVALDWPLLQQQETALLQYARQQLSTIPGLRLLGAPRQQLAVQSFTLADAHSHDVAQWLDQGGIALRSGQHCAMPLLQRLGVDSVLRVSLACYSNEQDIDRLVACLLDFRRTTGDIKQQPVVTVDGSALEQQLLAAAHDRERQFTLLMRLAQQLPDMRSIRLSAYQVHGCESQAWLKLTLDEQGLAQLAVDSDARIIRGLLAVLVSRCAGLTPMAIVEHDWLADFERLGLLRYLSVSRGNGLQALLAALVTQARALC